VQPTRSHFVCGTNRSGTSFLTGLLKSTGIAGRPEEYFWREDEPLWRERWGVETYAEYVAAALRARTTPNGVFGAKLLAGYAGAFLGKLRTATGKSALTDHELLTRVFRCPRWLWVRRRDVVAQAISFSKAAQTGVWYAEYNTKVPRPARFWRHQIDVLLRQIEAHNATWERWFEAGGIDPLRVVYEELEADLRGQTRRVFEFLGLPSAGISIEPQTMRQRDEVNAEWVRRYRSRG
jgi:LPS sulfotransferase NodH